MLGVPLFEVLANAQDYQPLAKKSRQLMEFASDDRAAGSGGAVGQSGGVVRRAAGADRVYAVLADDGEEGITRIENVNELKTNIIKYVEETEKLPQPSIDPDSPDEQPQIVLPTLAGFWRRSPSTPIWTTTTRKRPGDYDDHALGKGSGIQQRLFLRSRGGHLPGSRQSMTRSRSRRSAAWLMSASPALKSSCTSPMQRRG